MKRKIIGILAALVLAGVGTFALVVYVESAKDKAVAAEALVDVYVRQRDRPEGHTRRRDQAVGRGDRGAGEGRWSTTPSPTSTTSTRISSPPSTSGRRAAAQQPARRRPTSSAGPTVPAGLQEVTVALDPARAVGGALSVGDTVGVVLSFEPFDLPASEDQSPNMTHLTFHKVLVTAVQFAEGDGTSADRRADEDTDEDDGGRAGAHQPGARHPRPVLAAGRAGRVRRRVRPHLADGRERRRRRDRHPHRHARRGLRTGGGADDRRPRHREPRAGRPGPVGDRRQIRPLHLQAWRNGQPFDAERIVREVDAEDRVRRVHRRRRSARPRPRGGGGRRPRPPRRDERRAGGLPVERSLARRGPRRGPRRHRAGTSSTSSSSPRSGGRWSGRPACGRTAGRPLRRLRPRRGG